MGSRHRAHTCRWCCSAGFFCLGGGKRLGAQAHFLSVEPGDEVITADFTFAATVEVISLLKLKPVLVDVDPQFFNIDPKAIEKAITPVTSSFEFLTKSTANHSFKKFVPSFTLF